MMNRAEAMTCEFTCVVGFGIPIWEIRAEMILEPIKNFFVLTMIAKLPYHSTNRIIPRFETF